MHSYTGVFWFTIVSVQRFWERFQRCITVITWREHFGSHEMITPVPWCSFIIIGNFPHLERWSVIQVSAVPYRKFQSLVIKIVSVSVLSGTQGECKVTAKRMA
jgi:hypothetical protein